MDKEDELKDSWTSLATRCIDAIQAEGVANGDRDEPRLVDLYNAGVALVLAMAEELDNLRIDSIDAQGCDIFTPTDVGGPHYEQFIASELSLDDQMDMMEAAQERAEENLNDYRYDSEDIS